MTATPKSKIGIEVESTPLPKLIMRYSIPAILSGLVSAIYNIVDQIFIGWDLGVIGNSATNVAFPLVTISTSLALLFGMGSAANFSMHLGRQDINGAKKFVGVALTCITISGLIISAVALAFTQPLLTFFGATSQNIGYASTYTRIVAIGYPMAMMTVGGSHLIRADGSPKAAMKAIMSGAILNCFLDPLFIFGFNMGIAGAAYATITGQFVSLIMVINYFKKFKTFPINKEVLNFTPHTILRSAILGVAPAVNQLAMTITQIVMNNTLIYYGGQSIYGEDIPLACVGIITKVYIIYITIVVGIAQGTQPIVGYNFGACKYDKVMECYIKCCQYGFVVSIFSFIAFQFFPRQIISIFGTGSEEYFQFAQQYFKVYMFFTFLNFIQPITGNFFTAIGKGFMSSFVSLTKQLLFLVPLIIILPKFMGIDGVLYAGPVADIMAFVTAVVITRREFKILKKMQAEKNILPPNTNPVIS